MQIIPSVHEMETTTSIGTGVFDLDEEFQWDISNLSTILLATTTSQSPSSTLLLTTPSTTISSTISTATTSWLSTGKIQIPLYATILLLAIIGNSLVILTLIQNRRMRTITNVFLLNLAISDILLGVLCMPFTLIGTLLRDFVFGEAMCKLLPYLQATSVSVSAWTLVAISLERYYAICHPLRSRQWQTLKHAYKLIALIWISSFIFMLPIAALSRLIPTNNGHHKCREQWPDDSIDYERSFNLFLDVILLIIPLVLLSSAYFSITRTLWQAKNSTEIYLNTGGHARTRCQFSYNSQSSLCCQYRNGCAHSISDPHIVSSKKLSVGLRRTNTEKSLQNKKRVIQMLFVVVLEFFICWTPLYVINTIALFDAQAVYQTLGYSTISYFQLLAYSSSCCNPITYCFMNRGFRKACLNLFRCCKKFHETRRISIGGGPIGITQSSEVT